MKRIAKLAVCALMVAGTASVASADRWASHVNHRGHGYGGTNVALRIGKVGISFGTPRYSSNRYYGRGLNYGHSVGRSFIGGGRYGGHDGHGHGRRHRSHATWHDTSHYDYHPPSVIRHGNHYDYIPGHYDYHRTGHWDIHNH